MQNCLLNLKRCFGNTIGTFIYVVILFALTVWPSLLAIYLCKRGSFIWAGVLIFLFYWISAALSGLLGGTLSARCLSKDTDGKILIKDAGDGMAHVCIKLDETKGLDDLIEHEYCILEVIECADSETFNDYI